MSHVEVHTRTKVYYVHSQALGTPDVIATINDVHVCGVRIERPPGIAPSQWLAYWEGRR